MSKIDDVDKNDSQFLTITILKPLHQIIELKDIGKRKEVKKILS